MCVTVSHHDGDLCVIMTPAHMLLYIGETPTMMLP